MKAKSLLIILILFLLSSFYFVPTTFAKTTSGIDIEDGAGGLVDNTAVVHPGAWKPNTEFNAGRFPEIANVIAGIVQVIGTIVSVAVLIIIGIKYIIGSVEEKAEYKKTMLPYLIGAIMLFAASNLVQVIYNWAYRLNSF